MVNIRRSNAMAVAGESDELYLTVFVVVNPGFLGRIPGKRIGAKFAHRRHSDDHLDTVRLAGFPVKPLYRIVAKRKVK